MEVGMLYDCSTDSPIKGEFPWSRDELNKTELNYPSTKSNFIMEDESDNTEKVSNFEAGASLQASIFYQDFLLWAARLNI